VSITVHGGESRHTQQRLRVAGCAEKTRDVGEDREAKAMKAFGEWFAEGSANGLEVGDGIWMYVPHGNDPDDGSYRIDAGYHVTQRGAGIQMEMRHQGPRDQTSPDVNAETEDQSHSSVTKPNSKVSAREKHERQHDGVCSGYVPEG